MTHNRVLIVLLIAYFALQLLWLTSITKVWMDEPWYSNVAYNFVQGNGLIDTIARPGTAWFSFLYPLILGCFFWLFGTTVWVGRFTSVFAGAIALLGFTRILKLWKVKPKVILLTGVLFILSNVYYIIFRTIRPEAWCVAFSIWGLYYLAQGIQKNRMIDFMCSALLASFAVLCHPNAVLYVFLYGILVFGYSYRRKNSKYILGYLLVGFAVVIALLVYYVILSKVDLTTFLSNISETRTIYGKESALTTILNAPIVFVRNYSLGIKRIFILIFEIGALIVGLFFVKHDLRLFFTSLAGILFLLIALLLFQPFATRHFSEVLIFSLLATGLILTHISRKRKLYYSTLCLIAAYLINNMLGIGYLIYRDHDITPFDVIANEINRHVPDSSTVLAFMPFWFGLKNTEFYHDHTFWQEKDYENINQFLESNGPNYIVISPYLLAGRTGVAGRNENISDQEQINVYYQIMHSYAENNATLIVEIATNGYGSIGIWRREVSHSH